ncbi:hypothetical protein D8674_009217 [Pyrus ussuriensis x Pyrus communis]|uniref:Uncharacterized protein n=1 Tax=Pyrus ussuriensis x Pyrus communis TaxID=2448454 RepID=A0A5N5HVX6_9ROSA|nr:hypothetical protein D8674_009217 [Pyrus ussuriensis x Pyrus communis]
MHVELDHKCKVASKPRRNGKEAKTQKDLQLGSSLEWTRLKVNPVLCLVAMWPRFNETKGDLPTLKASLTSTSELRPSYLLRVPHFVPLLSRLSRYSEKPKPKLLLPHFAPPTAGISVSRRLEKPKSKRPLEIDRRDP